MCTKSLTTLNYRTSALLIGLALLLSACSTGFTQAPGAPGATSPNQIRASATPLPTRVVAVANKVTADGALALAAPEVALTFEQSARVTAVNAKLGQAVKKGDVLATVSDTTLQDAVADAQLALTLAEANLAVQNAPATREDIASAQAALSSAYASYNTTKSGSTTSAIASAKASLDSAWASYLSSQSSRDDTCGSHPERTQCKAAEATYGNTYESWRAAVDNYKKALEPVAQETLTQAYASVASAKAKLDALKAGVTSEQATVDTASLSQTQAALELAKSNLSKTKLVSPCDCVVQAVNVAAGVLPSGAAFTLVDPARIQFKTTNLTERDISRIKVGAAVTLRLKAYADEFTGKVSAVLAQSSGTQSSVALYTVVIDMDQTQAQLLPGMTGQAEISLL